jgi:hypothetical protein
VTPLGGCIAANIAKLPELLHKAYLAGQRE